MAMFKQNIPLINHTSYKIGGPARYFFEARDLDEVRSAVREAKKKDLPMFILGGGTNLLVSDEGFDGLILKPNLLSIERRGNEIHVGAGVPVAQLLDYLTTHSLTGLEWAGGLPGTVGGAVRGNAGAFGGETKDLIKSVRSFDIETLKEIEREASACDFDYRSSIFKKKEGKEIIMSAVFALKKGDAEAVRKSTHEKINYRRERHPLEYPNIGSIFKNVPLTQISADVTQINADTISVHPRLAYSAEVASATKAGRPASDGQARSNPRKSAFTAPVKTDPFPVVPAAYLISEAGLKGVSFGGAMISPKHPNFIVNVLEAKASEVKTLMQLVKNKVKRKFGITLEEEIILV